MRVLLTCKKRTWCGETRYVAELANWLAASGHLVTVAARREFELWPHLTGVSQRITLHLEHNFLAVRKLASDLLRLRTRLARVDLVHTNASWDTWLVAWARSAFALRTPFVRTRHNLKRIRRHRGNRWLYGRAIDAVIAPSLAIHEDTARSGILPEGSLRLARYAVDTRRFDPATLEIDSCRDKLSSRIGSRGGSPIVVLAGRLVARKQLELFVDAARELCAQGVDAHFVIAGQRPESSPYVRKIVKLAAGHEDRIHFLNFTDSMVELLAGCDISVLTATNEPFGLTVTEAMAMELPVVASASGGPLEMIQHGVDGLLFEPGNLESFTGLLRTLLGNPDRRRAMGKKARERVVKEFSWERCLSEHVSIYASLLEVPL